MRAGLVVGVLCALGCGSSGTSTPATTDAGIRDTGTDAASGNLAQPDGSTQVYMPGATSRRYSAPNCDDVQQAAHDLSDRSPASAYTAVCDRGDNLSPRYVPVEDCFHEATGDTAGTCLPGTLPPSLDPYDRAAFTCAMVHLYTYNQLDDLRAASNCDGGM